MFWPSRVTCSSFFKQRTTKGAVLLASSQACTNQGFIHDNRVIGLQFHLETTPASLKALIENCADELIHGETYVQTAEHMTQNKTSFEVMNRAMETLLNQLFMVQAILVLD